MRVLKKELWPHKVIVDIDNTRMKIDNVELWLAERVGGFKVKWNAVYNYNSTDYYFRDGKDATMFALRWS